MKSLLVLVLFTLCMPMAGQAPAFDELEFEPDSLKSAYKPSGKNYVFIRSKRGTSGVNKTASGDAILNAEVNEIVLVFSELDASAIADREEANRERWENLLKTYPEYFQFSTTYKNVCQCNNRGDSAAFKHAQGFYIYVNGDVPKVEEPKVAATPPPAPKAEESKPAAVAIKPIVKEQVAVADNTAVKTKEVPVVKETPAKEATPAKEMPKETAVTKETPKENKPVDVPVVAAPTVKEEPAATETEVVKKAPEKKTGAAKPRRAKDPKACRPACYQGGDEDLNAYFKDNLKFTKKQKKQAKKATSIVRIQLNFDGSIKKVMVAGENEEINQMVVSAVNGMSNWNPTVKAGVAIKSEVKLTLKYDGDNKAFRPFEVMITPRPMPKCKCVSDSEIFGD